MKRIAALLLAGLLACGMGGTAFASDVTIRTTVPERATAAPVEGGDPVDVPKTGDSGEVRLWSAAALLACGGLAGTALFGRKKGRDADGYGQFR